MKKIVLLPLLLLAACEEPPACMTPKEYGTIVKVSGELHEYCGRSGCNMTPSTTVAVRVNGVTRICSSYWSTPDMYPDVGEKVNLSQMKRVL